MSYATTMAYVLQSSDTDNYVGVSQRCEKPIKQAIFPRKANYLRLIKVSINYIGELICIFTWPLNLQYLHDGVCVVTISIFFFLSVPSYAPMT